jgi:hypothetical protein
MPFDFLKSKKDSKSTTPDLSDSSKSSKSNLKGKDFATQEAALKPEPEKKEKGPGLLSKIGGAIGGAMSSAKDKLTEGAQALEKGVLRKLLPDEKAKEYWQVVEMTMKLPLGTFLENYRGAFMLVASREFSTENVLFMEALKNGTDAKTIYETFLAKGAPQEINISGAARNKLIALAAKGDYGSMDFEEARRENNLTLTDTYSRVAFDDEAKRWIFTRLSGFKAPETVGAGY